MPTVSRSVLVSRPAGQMFDLVDDVDRYPQFLPWCSEARVLERTSELTRARLDIDYHGLRTHFTTVNRKHPPLAMDLSLEEGPFDRLEGRWTFTPLGSEGSRVELTVDYELASRGLDRVVAPVLGHILETLVDRFVARAESL